MVHLDGRQEPLTRHSYRQRYHGGLVLWSCHLIFSRHSKHNLGAEDLSNRNAESRYYLAAFKVIFLSQRHDIPQRFIDRHGAQFRTHNPHQPRAGVKPFSYFAFNVANAIARAQNFNGQIRSTNSVALDPTSRLDALTADKSHIRCSYCVGILGDYETCLSGVNFAEVVSTYMREEWRGNLYRYLAML